MCSLKDLIAFDALKGERSAQFIDEYGTSISDLANQLLASCCSLHLQGLNSIPIFLMTFSPWVSWGSVCQYWG